MHHVFNVPVEVEELCHVVWIGLGEVKRQYCARIIAAFKLN